MGDLEAGSVGAAGAHWRRGDQAAWWDATSRSWCTGVLVARVSVPSFEYDVSTTDGGLVRVPARLLRSPVDPDVTVGEPPAASPAATPVIPVTPPRRPGATLRERTG